MLVILTGHIQLGKTRWLEARLAELGLRGVEAWGVLTPGQWIAHEVDAEHPHGLEKVGIDMRFLPGGAERLYAVRADLSDMPGTSCTQVVGGAVMGWRFFDERFEEANVLFSTMRAMGKASSVHAPADGDTRRIAVIDELGRLELERACPAGLTEALAFVQDGPSAAFPHTVVIVRDFLLDAARAMFADCRPDGIAVISPDDAGRDALLSLFA